LTSKVSLALAAPYNANIVSSRFTVLAYKGDLTDAYKVINATVLQRLLPGPDLDELGVPWKVANRKTAARADNIGNGFQRRAETVRDVTFRSQRNTLDRNIS